MGGDCTNTPSECRQGFTISFWVHYIGGEFLLCTGAYISADKGPGVKFTVDEKQKLLVIEISALEYTWEVTSKLVSREWVHVVFNWSMNEGNITYQSYRKKFNQPLCQSASKKKN